MKYFPEGPPFRPTPEQLAAWTLRELQRVSAALETINDLTVDHAAIGRPAEGMFRYADGSDWNPGALKGLYYYNGTEWLPAGTIGSEIKTLADDATPTVLDGTVFLTGGTTTITDFDDGVEGQEIEIISEHAITITDGTNIFLNGSANWTMAATDTLTLRQKADGKWYEVARSDNT